MTRQLDCFVSGCDTTIEADTEDDVLSQASDHAEEAHPDLVLDEETVEKIRSRIREV